VRSKKHIAVTVYFVLLFCVLLFVFRPSFSNPPRSDFWCLFYYFHDYQDLPVFDRDMEIANYDIWEHGTCRPLFHLILYWLWFAFGSNYFWFHLMTFGFYCFSILLMYRLARNFGCGRTITAAFLTVFAFLFSHFDIVSWTFHIALIIGFCLFLSGFLVFLRFLRYGRSVFLIFAFLLFLLGMLCYEIFILWPLGLIILVSIRAFTFGDRSRSRILRRVTILAVAILYLAYGGVIVFSRSYSKIEGTESVLKKLISPSRITFSLAASSTAVIFNGIITNIDPFLTCPAIIQDNIGRGGIFLECSPALKKALSQRFLPGSINPVEPPLVISKQLDLDGLWKGVGPSLNQSILITGIISVLVLGCVIIWIYWKLRSRALKPLFLFFLLISCVFALFHGRMLTNEPLYIFRQFRYQYVPNALIVLLVLFFTDLLIKARKKYRVIPYVILGGILLVNLLALMVHVSILNEQLAPQDFMLSEIRSAIHDKRVNPAQKLYLDDSIAHEFPHLCWNNGMARFMKGTYQWMFRPGDISSFTFTEADAAWIISKDDYRCLESNEEQKEK